MLFISPHKVVLIFKIIILLLYRITLTHLYQNTLQKLVEYTYIHLILKNKVTNKMFRFIMLYVNTSQTDHRYIKRHTIVLYCINNENRANTVLNFYFNYG